MYSTKERKLVNAYAYIEARYKGKFPTSVSAGQIHAARLLSSIKITTEDIEEAVEFFKAHFGSDAFDRTPWDIIVTKYGGYLPLKMCALPEGTIVPLGTPMVTIESTDPECATIVMHFEGLIQKAIWYMTTVATTSLAYSSAMKEALMRTIDIEKIMQILHFMHHDFGYRGAASEEAAVLSGVAHLYISMGTDTMPAVEYIRKNMGGIIAGFSIPATEHNVMMSRGRDGEFEVVKNFLTRFPSGFRACVADTYDMRNFIERITTGEFFEIIMKSEGKFVIRPDSSFMNADGSEMTTAETILEIFMILGKNLPITINEKGFKILPSQYGVIYGDGLDIPKIIAILDALIKNGWSASNIVFGTGGNLVQKGIDRDTQRFAFKVSEQTYVHADGTVEVLACGKETPGKESKKGRFKVCEIDGMIVTLGEHERPDLPNMLVPFYINGTVCDGPAKDTIVQIRERINVQREKGGF
jgi:nicotinamide phosphoribosyltransferase